MTLIASALTTSTHQDDPYSEEDNRSSEDTQSNISDDNVSSTFQPIRPFDYTSDALVQCLGHPNSDVVPHIGQISIENSSDVHFGDKNIYQGPVTIKQVVYANGNASLVANSDKAKDNYAFERDTEDFKASERKDCFEASVGDAQGTRAQSASGFIKGFIWLQNVSQHRTREIGIFVTVLVLFVVVLMVVLLRHPPGKVPQLNTINNSEPDVIRPIGYDPDLTASSQAKNKLRIVSRYEWVAQPPINDTTPLVTPVPYVIIHHTATENCSSQSQCVFHVRQIQTFHIESRGWYDIGYNFLVGGDGAAYEGRGWIVEGAHTLGWNSRSIGIAFIGTFLNKQPPDIQILACQRLISRGVQLGYIKEDYKLLGARQLFATESPGTVLLEEIKKWPHWTKEP